MGLFLLFSASHGQSPLPEQLAGVELEGAEILRVENPRVGYGVEHPAADHRLGLAGARQLLGVEPEHDLLSRLLPVYLLNLHRGHFHSLHTLLHFLSSHLL